MRIVHQSAVVSYSPLLALPAPKIAGLLPAHVGEAHPPTATASRCPPLPREGESASAEKFAYEHPRLAELSDAQRERLFEVTRTLLDVAVGRALDEFNDHALNTALSLFRSIVTGQPSRPTNPAQYDAEMDAPLLEWLVGSVRREVRHE